MRSGRSAICPSASWCSAATTGCSPTAASATPPRADEPAKARVVAVAYSGGRDSTALLHATVAAAEPLGIAVLALHVHHGLSASADAWLAHCTARCRRWARSGRPVELVAHRVATRPAAGESVEAWARRARYRALREMAVARAADLVLLGHHRRDQAETFLLQALRGGGVAALAAMPKRARREGVTWARPWLDLPREAIEAYARAHRLRWIDDDSNDDLRFARNRLRHDVWPALTVAFGDAEASLATAARHVAQAAALIDEVAAADFSTISGDDRLDLVAWRALSIARQRAALRHWLQRVTGIAAPASLVERLMDEAHVDGTRRWPAVDGALHSYRGRLGFERSALAVVDEAASSVDLGRPGTHGLERWGGAMRVDVVDRNGIDVARAARLAVRARRPGDRFQAGPGRPPRSLKLQFQAAGVPTSGRAGPVLCDGETLVFVAGLGIDARAVAAIGDAQVSLTWLPSAEPRAEGAG